MVNQQIGEHKKTISLYKKSSNAITLDRFQEIFYFLGLVMYLLVFLQYETQWVYPEKVLWLMRLGTTFFLSLATLFALSKYKKGTDFFVLFISLAVSLIVGKNAGFQTNLNLLYETRVTFLLVFGAKDIEFKKILKVFLIVGGSYCLITVLASLLGIVKNVVHVSWSREEAILSTGNIERLCFGYSWSTNMANHVFFILLCYFAYINKPFKPKEAIIIFLIAFAIWYYTGSRLSAICIFMMLVISVVYGKSWGQESLISKILTWGAVFCIPIFAYVSYLATAAFDNSDVIWLAANILLTGRLGLGNEALSMAGIPMWGQFYQMYSSAQDDGDFYNYIDCSYVQSLVIYGLVYTIMLVSAYLVICQRAKKRNDVFLLYSIALAGISGIIAQHFLELYMNPFLIALFAKHTKKNL